MGHKAPERIRVMVRDDMRDAPREFRIGRINGVPSARLPAWRCECGSIVWDLEDGCIACRLSGPDGASDVVEKAAVLDGLAQGGGSE